MEPERVDPMRAYGLWQASELLMPNLCCKFARSVCCGRAWLASSVLHAASTRFPRELADVMLKERTGSGSARHTVERTKLTRLRAPQPTPPARHVIGARVVPVARRRARSAMRQFATRSSKKVVRLGGRRHGP